MPHVSTSFFVGGGLFERRWLQPFIIFTRKGDANAFMFAGKGVGWGWGAVLIPAFVVYTFILCLPWDKRLAFLPL